MCAPYYTGIQSEDLRFREWAPAHCDPIELNQSLTSISQGFNSIKYIYRIYRQPAKFHC